MLACSQWKDKAHGGTDAHELFPLLKSVCWSWLGFWRSWSEYLRTRVAVHVSILLAVGKRCQYSHAAVTKCISMWVSRRGLGLS